MAFAVEDADATLRPLIRSIDKRVEYQLGLVEAERPGVIVTLSLRRRTTSVTVPVDSLTAADQNSMLRNQLRTTLKRALDRMMFDATPLASTKMMRTKTHADGFFRPPHGGRGRR